jgi:hypothetical protein
MVCERQGEMKKNEAQDTCVTESEMMTVEGEERRG